MQSIDDRKECVSGRTVVEMRESRHSSGNNLRKVRRIAEHVRVQKEVLEGNTKPRRGCREISGSVRRRQTSHLSEFAKFLVRSGVNALLYSIKPTSSLAFASSDPAIPSAKAADAWSTRLSDNTARAVMATIQCG